MNAPLTVLLAVLAVLDLTAALHLAASSADNTAVGPDQPLPVSVDPAAAPPAPPALLAATQTRGAEAVGAVDAQPKPPALLAATRTQGAEAVGAVGTAAALSRRRRHMVFRPLFASRQRNNARSGRRRANGF
ncbi:uncharacterized protein LOC113204751 [Frankliniella occidentalis]|uniref:Uncharacterized protein LOC113204751 n=1 Tax=Frankliniella occidentalis TaxID=133901 RepID=A0A6J1SAU5_FRAOC|nr:uncharacterized protein LOC113204751 [Frankliniella occidentalis]